MPDPASRDWRINFDELAHPFPKSLAFSVQGEQLFVAMVMLISIHRVLFRLRKVATLTGIEPVLSDRKSDVLSL